MEKNMENRFLEISEEVSDAIEKNIPIVAIETSAIFSNLQYPENKGLADIVMESIREYEVVPALIAVINGKIKIGLSDEDIESIGTNIESVSCIAKKDLALSIAAKETGVLTTSATVEIASIVGIKIVVCASIGGIINGADQSLNVSPDIDELSKKDVLIVCSGIKPGCDVTRTLELIETRGICVAGFKTEEVPCLFYLDKDAKVNYCLDTPQAVALAYNVKRELGVESSLVVMNPVNKNNLLSKEEFGNALNIAFAEAREKRLSRHEFNKYIFSRLKELTAGASKSIFMSDVNGNAQLAAWVAFAMYKDKNTFNVNIGIANNIRKINKPIQDLAKNLGLAVNLEDNQAKANENLGQAQVKQEPNVKEETKADAEIKVKAETKGKASKPKQGMDFYLWLFAVKNLAQTYDACKLIYGNLSEERQKALKAEYDKTYN